MIDIRHENAFNKTKVKRAYSMKWNFPSHRHDADIRQIWVRLEIIPIEPVVAFSESEV